VEFRPADTVVLLAYIPEIVLLSSVCLDVLDELENNSLLVELEEFAMMVVGLRSVPVLTELPTVASPSG